MYGSDDEEFDGQGQYLDRQSAMSQLWQELEDNKK